MRASSAMSGAPHARRHRIVWRLVPFCLAAALLSVPSAAPTAADPPATAVVMTADGAERAGLKAALTRREVRGQVLLEALLPSPGGQQLLAASADGTRVASADRIGGLTARVAIQGPDGAVAVRQLPGVVAAQFIADGSALLAIDTSGALWRIASATAEGSIIAPGPFDGPFTPEASGTMLLRRVSSVEAPFSAQLVRLDPASAAATSLDADGLVFSAHPLSDGSLAVVAHRPGAATSVSRLTPNGLSNPIAELGPAAIAADVAEDGRIAFEIAGDGVYLLEPGAAKAHRLGAGGAPSFSPDGRELLVRQGGGTSVLGLDGSVLARTDTTNSTWIACGEGCGS